MILVQAGETAVGRLGMIRENLADDHQARGEVWYADLDLDLLGLPFEFPEDGYQGDYIRDIARTLVDEGGDRFRDADLSVFKERAQQAIFADIDATLKRIGIGFDTYFNEHTLYEDGRVDGVVEELRSRGLVYEKVCLMVILREADSRDTGVNG